MLLLALETTAAPASVALIETRPPAEGCVRATRAAAGPARAAAEVVIALVDDLLAGAGVPYAALELIVVNPGPGSFTGVRTGVAAARGLALATGLPVLPVSGLEALAAAVPARPGELRVAAQDARRGEVYVQAFDPDLHPLAPPALAAPAAALAGLAGPLCLIGSGAPLLRAALPAEAPVREAEAAQDAGALGRAAALRLARGERGVPGYALRPLYLRAPDAHPQQPWYAAGETALGPHLNDARPQAQRQHDQHQARRAV